MRDSDAFEPYDVVIVGGGLVGATLALRLTQCELGAPKLKVALLERADLPGLAVSASPSFDLRATALSLSSERILEDLGLWAELKLQGMPIRDIHVSEQGRWGVNRLQASSQRLTHFGHVVPNQAIGRALWAAIEKREGLTVFSPVDVAAIEPREQGVRVVCNEGPQLNARLVVLADGGRSGLLDALGIACDEYDYHQQALVATVETAKPSDGWAFERFCPGGAMAFLPMPDFEGRPRNALIWSCPDSEAESRLAQSPEALLAEVRESLGDRLGGLRYLELAAAYPLKRVIAREQVRSGLVILGNAAHALHPVAGQGFNLSLRDTEALAKHIQSHPEFETLKALQEYDRARRGDQALTLMATDVLLATFAGQFPGLRSVRQAGMLALELVPGLKQQVARLGMEGAGSVLSSR